MTARHSDPAAFDGCRHRTEHGALCGHSPAAHDLPLGGCSLCHCTSYGSPVLPTALVIGALLLLIGAVLVLSGVLL